jgi:CBS-domain-containing membrane protein
MTKYETLTTLCLDPQQTRLCTDTLPEVMHLDDSALAVMIDFKQTPAKTITADTSIDDALHRMKMQGAHLLFVVNQDGQPLGLITSEDLLGEQPIKIQQERRIPRSKLLATFLMTPIEKIPGLPVDVVSHFKVGNIINTLKTCDSHYALVLKEKNGEKMIVGLFTASQISQQLHRNIES